MNHWNGNPDSVMSAIMSMTTPPSTENGKKKKNDKRVAVKEINCKGCGEPGDILLVCKSCSVGYHPLCDDPPKDEDLVKDMVDWKCRSCRNKNFLTANDDDEEEDEESATAASSAAKGAGAGVAANKRVSWKDMAPSTGPLKQVKKGGKKKQKRKRESSPDVLDTIEKIMKTGVETCKSMNPSIFEIPSSFRRNDYVFPGTSRSSVKKATKRNIVDLESEIVPKPTVLCFQCGLSCRKAPLIQCDYCPSFFHFDCLTPPLTSPPGGIWMCPLHPEPFLETVRLTSSALSERIRLWDTTHRQRDSHSVVLSFMSKTQRNPLYSFRKQFPHSKMFFPADNREKPDYSGYPNNIADYMQNSGSSKTKIATDNIQNSGSSKTKIATKRNTKRTATSAVPGSSEKCSNKKSKTLKGVNKPKLRKADVIDLDIPDSEPSKKPSKKKEHDLEAPPPKKRATESSCAGFDLLLEAAAQTNDNDERRYSLLRTIPLEHVYSLAFQRLKDLDAIYAEKSAAASTSSPRVEKEASTTNNPQLDKKTVPLIQFFIHNTASQLDINSTAIEIGLKEASKSYYTWLNPENYVKCSRFSSRDLLVFFDPLKLQWEFLTYSPYGVVVDSVLHTLQDPKLTADKKSELSDFKMSIFEKRGLKVTSSNPRNPASSQAKCECDAIRANYATSISHECGGILTVGSTIRVGCLRLTVKRLTVDEAAVNGDAA